MKMKIKQAGEWKYCLCNDKLLFLRWSRLSIAQLDTAPLCGCAP